MQTVKLIITLAGMCGPGLLLLRAMGWMSLIHVSLIAAWALVSTALIILTAPRHRRAGWPTAVGLVILGVWLTLAVLVVGSGWSARVVVAVLLVLPGLNYLLLEAIGLTPSASERNGALY